MTDLRLISQTASPSFIKPLIEAALMNEVRLMEAGIRKTEHRVRRFEKQYDMSTSLFLSKYEDDQLDETLDFMEWIGESRLLERLQEKAEALRGLHFAN